MNAVEVSHVSKSYPVYASPTDRLKEMLTLRQRSFHEEFRALEDISFTVAKGQAVGLLGENGSGKSTLLQIIAGILEPTSGEVRVQGRASALLELGSGFHQEYTGIDNVYLNASILGLSREEIDRRLPAIEAFAEIGDFIQQPVKTYSSGMLMRLAFAVAIHVDPEVLIVDESLAVGDIYFRQRCLRKVHELRSRGVTLLFVSHEVGDVKAICDTCLWLEKGRLVEAGETRLVAARYMAAMMEKDTRRMIAEHAAADKPKEPVLAPEIVRGTGSAEHRYGDGRARIIGLALVNPRGQTLRELAPAAHVVLRVSVSVQEDLALPMVGFLLRNWQGVDMFGTNTTREGRPLPAMAAGDVHTIDFHWTVPELASGTYKITAAISDGTLERYSVLDYLEGALPVRLANPKPTYGQVHLACRVDLEIAEGQK